MKKMPRRELAKVIAERTMHSIDTKELAQEVAAYLLAEGRTAELETLIRDIMQYRQDHGIIEATAVTSHDIGSNVISDVEAIVRQQYPDAKSIAVHSVHDQHVVGGVRIELAQSQLDMTVQAKLNTFKRLTSPERN